MPPSPAARRAARSRAARARRPGVDVPPLHGDVHGDSVVVGWDSSIRGLVPPP